MSANATDRAAASPRAAGATLLAQLDTIVGADELPTKLSGLVCVAVRGSGTAQVWYANFDQRLLGSGFLAGLPADADAVMLLDETDAMAILAGQEPGGAHLFGDTELLAAFVTRYCAQASWLTVRMGG